MNLSYKPPVPEGVTPPPLLEKVSTLGALTLGARIASLIPRAASWISRLARGVPAAVRGVGTGLSRLKNVSTFKNLPVGAAWKAARGQPWQHAARQGGWRSARELRLMQKNPGIISRVGGWFKGKTGKGAAGTQAATQAATGAAETVAKPHWAIRAGKYVGGQALGMAPWIAFDMLRGGGGGGEATKQYAPGFGPSALGANRPGSLWQYPKHASAERQKAFEYGVDQFCKEAGFDEDDRRAMYGLIEMEKQGVGPVIAGVPLLGGAATAAMMVGPSLLKGIYKGLTGDRPFVSGLTRSMGEDWESAKEMGTGAWDWTKAQFDPHSRRNLINVIGQGFSGEDPHSVMEKSRKEREKRLENAPEHIKEMMGATPKGMFKKMLMRPKGDTGTMMPTPLYDLIKQRGYHAPQMMAQDYGLSEEEFKSVIDELSASRPDMAKAMKPPVETGPLRTGMFGGVLKAAPGGAAKTTGSAGAGGATSEGGMGVVKMPALQPPRPVRNPRPSPGSAPTSTTPSTPANQIGLDPNQGANTAFRSSVRANEPGAQFLSGLSRGEGAVLPVAEESIEDYAKRRNMMGTPGTVLFGRGAAKPTAPAGAAPPAGSVPSDFATWLAQTGKEEFAPGEEHPDVKKPA